MVKNFHVSEYAAINLAGIFLERQDLYQSNQLMVQQLISAFLMTLIFLKDPFHCEKLRKLERYTKIFKLMEFCRQLTEHPGTPHKNEQNI